MPSIRLVAFASSISLAAIACIDQPSFVLDEGDTTTSTSPTSPISGEGDDEMVLIATTTFPTQGTLAPTAPGSGNEGNEGKGEGKGKGKGGGGGGGGGNDAGAPPPVDAGAPAPGSTTTTVPAFWIDTREVSARAYAACVAANGCTPAGREAGCTVAAGLDDHPANCVTIDQARAFCASRGKRLVANDEWTAAAAGSTTRPHPWGAEAPSSTRLNACGASECGERSMYPDPDGFEATAPRGSFAAGRTPEGVWDLAGNVAEWVDVAGAQITRGGSFADSDVASVSSLAVRTERGASASIGFRCAKNQ